MTTEENKAIVRRFFEEFTDGGNMDAVEKLVTPDFVWSDVNVRGRESLKNFVGTFRSAFPDLQHQVEDQIAERDKVATRWTTFGTHQGALMGTPATGKRVVFTAIVIDRIVDGMMAERWESIDMLGLLQQIGAIPVAGQK